MIGNRNGRDTTVELVRDYYKETGRDVFLYKDMRRFYYRQYPNRRHLPDWHTIERWLRELSEEGMLARDHPSPRRVVFYMRPMILRGVK